MMSLVLLLLVSSVFSAIQATQLTKCELSEKLKDLDGYGNIPMSECECLATFVSLLSFAFPSPVQGYYVLG